MKKGRIVIISGPSGSGKTTLYKKLLLSKNFKGNLVRSISMTTRPKRKGEKDGRDYSFISEKKFLYKKKAGHFLECQKVFRSYYGTPHKNVREFLKKGKHVLLCIDVKGAMVVWRKHPDALKIFIKTPSMAILKKRLASRATECKKELKIRLKTAQSELKEAKYYDYVVVNDSLKKAFNRLKEIIRIESVEPQA